MDLGQWIGLLVLVVSLYILWQIQQILFLAFIAVILATALNRIVQRLQQSGAKRGFAVALAIGLSLALLVIFVAMILPPIIEQFQQFITLVPEGLEQLRVWFDSLQAWIPRRLLENINRLRGLAQQLQPLATWLLDHLYAMFYNFLAILLNSLLVIVLTIMLLANPQPYRQAFIQLFPAFYRQRVDDILCECEVGLIGWLTGILLSMTFIGVTSGVDMDFAGTAATGQCTDCRFIRVDSLCRSNLKCSTTDGDRPDRCALESGRSPNPVLPNSAN